MDEKKCVVCEAVKHGASDPYALALAGYLVGYKDGLENEKYRCLCRNCTAAAGGAEALVGKV